MFSETKPAYHSKTSEPLSISPQPPIHSPQESNVLLKKIFPFGTGLLAGIMGRLSINNLTDMTAAYQNNKNFSWKNTSFSATRGMLFGSALQVSCAFGSQAFLVKESDSLAVSSTKNIFAGILSGLIMHPAAVNFFYTNNQLGMQPSLKIHYTVEFFKLCMYQPKIFYRGLALRCIFSGVEWGTFFTCKDTMIKHGHSYDHAVQTAATASIFATTPFYQHYIHKIQHGNSSVLPRDIPSSSNKDQSFILKNLTRLNSRTTRTLFLFTTLSIIEKNVCEYSKTTLESH